jgi:hypothetical protein
MIRVIGVGIVLCLTFLACASDPEMKQAPASGATPGAAGAAPSSSPGASGAPAAAGSGMASAAGSGAAATAGSGTTSSMSTGGVNCSALPPPSNADDVVANFEDGTGAVLQVGGRGGGFYMFNDGTGMQTPPPGMLPPATKADRCGSTYALCMSGKGFMTWGAGMGTDFAPTSAGMGMGTKQTYDAGAYKGIAFWAKSNTATASVRVGFKDKDTAPEGGQCDAMMTSGAQACNDDFGKAISLTNAWQPFTVMFSDLTQAGWGKAFTAFNAKAVYSVQFQVSQGVDFDLCVDDVAFVR